MKFKGILHALVLLIVATPIFSQSISIQNIDRSGYPIIKGEIIPYDLNGRRISNLNKSDWIVSENGVTCRLESIRCPDEYVSNPVSAVLALDVSGSMGSYDRMQIAINSAKSWINAMNENSECAIVTFNSNAYLTKPMTNDKSELSRSVSYLRPDGFEDFYKSLDLSIEHIISNSTNDSRKVIAFLTDGEDKDDDNDIFENWERDEIIRKASNNNIFIFSIAIGMECCSKLKLISESTGGQWFSNLNTENELMNLYLTLLNITQNDNPCKITWKASTPRNEPIREIRVQSPTNGIDVTFNEHIINDLSLKFFNGMLYPAKFQNGKWGYIKIINDRGIEVISPQFSKALEFSDGLAAVVKDNNFGLIDKKGNVIIPFKYAYVGSFKNGLAIAESTNGKIGFIDANDSIVIPFDYDSAPIFWSTKFNKLGYVHLRKNGKDVLVDKDNINYFGLKNGYYGFIEDSFIVESNYKKKHNNVTVYDNNRNTISTAIEGIVSVKHNIAIKRFRNKVYFVNLLGEKICNTPFDRIYTEANIIDGDIIVKVWENNSKGKLETYYNVSQCKKFINKQYDYLSPLFSEGVAFIRQRFSKKVFDIKYRLINQNGDFVSNNEFDWINTGAENFSNGLRAVGIGNNGTGFANSKGELVIKCNFNYLSEFKNGFCRVGTSDNREGYINTKGEWVWGPY